MSIMLSMKTLRFFLCVCGVIFYSHFTRGEPAPETAKALARAAVASLTNAFVRLLPAERDRLLADAQPALAYYQQVLDTTNWSKFITSTSPVPPVLHMTFQFYFGVRSNFDDIDPWERLTLIHPLPLGEAALELPDMRMLAARDKLFKVTWLSTFVELGPEQVLRRFTYAPPSVTLGYAKRVILDLFERPYLLGTLSVQDWEIVARCLEAFQKMQDADLKKIALDRATITGTQPDTNWIEMADAVIHVQYLPRIASAVLSPKEQNQPFNTNLLSALLEPVGLWLEEQCWKLQQLWIGITNTYAEKHVRVAPHGGWDRRPLYNFRAGFVALTPVIDRISKSVTPIQPVSAPRPLDDKAKRLLNVVQAYMPFDPDSPDLNRALEAVNRGDVDLCGETLVIEFAILNLRNPLLLLGQWAEHLPENRSIAESLTNIVSRLNGLPQGLEAFGVSAPGSLTERAAQRR